MRYIAFAADQLLRKLDPAPGAKILDVAAGTGATALAAAQAVGTRGRVTAIDLSEAMLARLGRKLDKFGIDNVDVHAMDAARLDFRRDYFDHVMCSLALHGFAHPAAAVREWVRVLRPGGTLMLAGHAERSFEPLLGLLAARLRQLGIEAAASWVDTGTPEALAGLLRQAGCEDVVVTETQLGYHVTDPAQWWEVAEHGVFPLLFAALPVERRERLREEHLAEITVLSGADGLWLDVPVLFARGRKPAAGGGRI